MNYYIIVYNLDKCNSDNYINVCEIKYSNAKTLCMDPPFILSFCLVQISRTHDISAALQFCSFGSVCTLQPILAVRVCRKCLHMASLVHVEVESIQDQMTFFPTASEPDWNHIAQMVSDCFVCMRVKLRCSYLHQRGIYRRFDSRTKSCMYESILNLFGLDQQLAWLDS